jgi:hypothetical protein
MHLYHYGEVQNVPDGVVMKDAREIMPLNEELNNKCFAQFSDIFRYKLIYDKGGWWVDSDVLCLRPNPYEEREIMWGREGNDNRWVSNATMYARKSSKYMLDLYEGAIEVLKGGKFCYCDMGPILLEKYVKNNKLEHTLMPREAFSPISGGVGWWIFSRGQVSAKIEEWTQKSFVMHIWRATCRLAGIDFNQTYNKRSTYEKYKKKYGISGSNAGYRDLYLEICDLPKI